MNRIQFNAVQLSKPAAARFKSNQTSDTIGEQMARDLATRLDIKDGRVIAAIAGLSKNEGITYALIAGGSTPAVQADMNTVSSLRNKGLIDQEGNAVTEFPKEKN